MSLFNRTDGNRFLVVQLRAIGDVLLSTVVLRNLRTAFPRARIDFLTESASREVVNRHPAVDEVIPVASRRWRKACESSSAIAILLPCVSPE